MVPDSIRFRTARSLIPQYRAAAETEYQVPEVVPLAGSDVVPFMVPTVPHLTDDSNQLPIHGVGDNLPMPQHLTFRAMDAAFDLAWAKDFGEPGWSAEQAQRHNVDLKRSSVVAARPEDLNDYPALRQELHRQYGVTRREALMWFRTLPGASAVPLPERRAALREFCASYRYVVEALFIEDMLRYRPPIQTAHQTPQEGPGEATT